MDLAPCSDVSRLNQIANHPSVRPYLGVGDDFMDTQWILDLPGTVCLMGEHGGFIFLRVLEGLYSMHCLMLPQGRGGQTVRAAMDAVSHLFGSTDAKAITTEAPVGNASSKWLARRVGFVQVGVRPASDGLGQDMVDFVLTRPAWAAAKTSKGVN